MVQLCFQLAIDPYGVYALIVAPTRELVNQIAEQLLVLGKPINLRLCVLTGGRKQITQAQQLSEYVFVQLEYLLTFR